MKIFIVRLVVLFWALTIIGFLGAFLVNTFDEGIISGIETAFGVLAFFGFLTLIFSFLTLGILDPRKVFKLLEANK